ncbi:MAG: hypothetical protein JWM59_3159 [Verrucomicrobiales bacterium]|nr:hypothetical protein [Verrucomicrobiales bacterium]
MIEIYTVGYEKFTAGDFTVRLSRSAVEHVVDVRELPISRKKGFAKNALRAALEENGIGYSHAQYFGCPRPVRNAYRETNDWSAYTVSFKHYIKTRHKELEALGAAALECRLALLCLEDDYNFCHRTYVAEEMAAAMGEEVTIRHLTGPMKNRTAVVPALRCHQEV